MHLALQANKSCGMWLHAAHWVRTGPVDVARQTPLAEPPCSHP